MAPEERFTARAKEGHERPGCSGKPPSFCIVYLFIHVQRVQFLRGLVRHSPDAYLDEMQELLETRRGVDVGKATVWRALVRSGFTMKKA